MYSSIWHTVSADTQLESSILFGIEGCVFIYIAAASPNRRSIGATNGFAQMTVSIMRTIGPSFTNSLFSLSMEHNYLGGWLVWWAMLGLCTMALVGGLQLPKKVWKREGEVDDEA